MTPLRRLLPEGQPECLKQTSSNARGPASFIQGYFCRSLAPANMWHCESKQGINCKSSSGFSAWLRMEGAFFRSFPRLSTKMWPEKTKQNKTHPLLLACLMKEGPDHVFSGKVASLGRWHLTKLMHVYSQESQLWAGPKWHGIYCQYRRSEKGEIRSRNSALQFVATL